MASQTMRAITGVVEAVGPEVSDFAVGDEVYGATGLRLGAYGEFVVVPARAAIAAKPASMTFAEAAAVPLGAINALHFLRRAEVEPGDSVLINGAGGVIGAYGVQVARMMGAEVTGERIQTANAHENRAVLEELAAMIDASELSSIVDRVLPMEQASEAHRLVDTEQRVGAIVLAIGPDANEQRAPSAP